jgi:hypothetical protein
MQVASTNTAGEDVTPLNDDQVQKIIAAINAPNIKAS